MYTKRGQIAQVKQGTTIIASYSYDYRNRRTRKTAGGVTTVYHYDQWDHLIAETTTANIPLKTYAYRDDVPVAQIEHGSTPKVVYLHTDNLGTPRAGRDSQRLTVWSWNSDAFGSTLANSDPDGNSVLTTVNLRFPGQYYDAESGLHYNNQRFYDPKLGRYLQSDPIGLEGGINTYAYVANNPLLYTDPFGLNPGAAAGAFVGSIALPGVGTVAGAAIGSAIGFVLGWWIIDNSRASGEEKLPNVNPGKDCNGNCNPCPPGKRWWVPKPGHGHENGYWHTIIYNQNKETCECFSDRPSSGLDGS